MPVALHHFVCSAPRVPRRNQSFSGDRPRIPMNPGQFPASGVTDFLRRFASVVGSGADYSEQLLGTERKKKKKKSVAGVDQDELLDPTMLADPDSCFCEFKGLQIHHKICHHEEEQVEQPLFQVHSSSEFLGGKTVKLGIPVILLHGFGASVFSWDRVMRPLARLIGSKVLAFDRPAFGLTTRTSFLGHSDSGRDDTTPFNPYSMAFSVLATLSFIDSLGSEKAILMGHSAGCLVAVDTYFEAPERIAALILVAPAIVAPFVQHNVKKENEIRKETQVEGKGSNTNVQENPFVRIWRLISGLFRYIAEAATHMMKAMNDMARSLYRKSLSAILRSSFSVMLVRMVIDKFSVPAVRNSWYDATQVTDHVIQGYTKPLRVKGWEMALLEYTLAMLTDSASESKPPLTRRLAEISCPVLIVTGDTDRLVPSWNAERLSYAIPGSTLEVIKNCGHLPHEERVEDFLLAVKKFLERSFGAMENAAFASSSYC